MSDGIEERVTREVEELHEFFVGWFSGALGDEALDEAMGDRFDPDFVLISPSGKELGIEALRAGMRGSRGSNPDFRITIRNVRVRRVMGEIVLATYEEWQANALASEPPDNARLATALFRRGDRLRWLHLHETAMPT